MKLLYRLIFILMPLSCFAIPSETGWSEFVPSSGARSIYVSSSGNDSNPGTVSSPVKTAARAYLLTRNNMPDQILFKRGDTFSGAPKSRNGRSVTEPSVLGAYGTGERPLFKIEPNSPSNGCGKFRVWTSLHYQNYKRDPSLGATAASIVENTDDGIVCVWKEAHDLRMEDMKFEFFRLPVYYNGGQGPGVSNLTFYRNVYKDQWASAKGVRDRKAQGTYMSAVKNAKWIENIFLRNGWSPLQPLSGRSYLNHSLYLHNMKDVLVRGNISALSSSLGLKFNSSAVAGSTNVLVDDNLIIGSGNGVSITSNDKIADAYLNVKVTNNVHTHVGAGAQTDAGTIVKQGLGMYLVHIKNVEASNNVFVDKNYDTGSPAITLSTVSGTKSLKSNVVYKYAPSSPSLSDPSNLVEPAASVLVDATRNINTYMGTADGESELYKKLPSMRKGNWDAKYTAPVINAWLRAGIKKK